MSRKVARYLKELITFDSVVCFLVNAISFSSVIYSMNRWFNPKATNVFLAFFLPVLMWAIIDFIVAAPIICLNQRFKFFHSDWEERDEENRKNREFEKDLAQSFSGENTGKPITSPQGLWERPRL